MWLACALSQGTRKAWLGKFPVQYMIFGWKTKPVVFECKLPRCWRQEQTPVICKNENQILPLQHTHSHLSSHSSDPSGSHADQELCTNPYFCSSVKRIMSNISDFIWEITTLWPCSRRESFFGVCLMFYLQQLWADPSSTTLRSRFSLDPEQPLWLYIFPLENNPPSSFSVYKITQRGKFSAKRFLLVHCFFVYPSIIHHNFCSKIWRNFSF